jgi:two-component sensor histidine kinase
MQLMSAEKQKISSVRVAERLTNNDSETIAAVASSISDETKRWRIQQFFVSLKKTFFQGRAGGGGEREMNIYTRLMELVQGPVL